MNDRTTATRPAGTPLLGCGVAWVRAGAGYEGVRGLSYSAGISAESAGARGLCLHTLVIPPGGRARAHPACPARVGDLHRVRGERDVGGVKASPTTTCCGRATSSTSRPMCRTCRATPAPPSRLSRWWPVRIRTSRRASCCCPTLTTCRRCPDGSPAIGSVERSHYSSLPGRVRKKLSRARFGRRPHDPR